jgi:hypothetical protein
MEQNYEKYPNIAGPQDALLQLEPMTLYAASYSTPPLDQAPPINNEPNLVWEKGISPRNYILNVNVTALVTGGGQTYQDVLQESDDGINWENCGGLRTITAVGVTSIGFATKSRFLRRRVVIAGGGASITNQSWVSPNWIS